MNKENIVMTGADYTRLMGSLNLLFGAVKEMSGVLMGYESTGFISPDSLQMEQEKHLIVAKLKIQNTKN